ncbi:MAG: hypothetical protein RLZZ480_43 [Candidatus Parcubacteria bacterium]|jgi:hypothetical protein
MPYVIAILVVAILGVGFTFFQANKSEAPAPAAQETSVPTTNTTAGAASYKDGSHVTKVTYMTPARSEYALDVTLVLENDIVTDAQVTYSQGAEKDPNAAKFDAAYRTEVIGKDIDAINLSRVGGASLTTGAFNNAVANIKNDAKS